MVLSDDDVEYLVLFCWVLVPVLFDEEAVLLFVGDNDNLENTLLLSFLCCALVLISEPTEPVLCLHFICASALFIVSFICWTLSPEHFPPVRLRTVKECFNV